MCRANPQSDAWGGAGVGVEIIWEVVGQRKGAMSDVDGGKATKQYFHYNPPPVRAKEKGRTLGRTAERRGIRCMF